MRLQNGQMFPKLEVPAVGGGVIRLPEVLAGAYGVVLVYRGHWCPYCRAQLRNFERARSRLVDLGVRVVAFSVDDEATTAGVMRENGLNFAVGHSADPDQMAAATGAYVNAGPRYLQPTAFLLAPDGSVLNAVYASGPVGRLVAEDAAGVVAYYQSKA